MLLSCTFLLLSCFILRNRPTYPRIYRQIILILRMISRTIRVYFGHCVCNCAHAPVAMLHLHVHLTFWETGCDSFASYACCHGSLPGPSGQGRSLIQSSGPLDLPSADLLGPSSFILCSLFRAIRPKAGPDGPKGLSRQGSTTCADAYFFWEQQA